MSVLELRVNGLGGADCCIVLVVMVIVVGFQIRLVEGGGDSDGGVEGWCFG